MRLQVHKADALRALANLFQSKVQMEEKLKETEAQIQFQRGVIGTIDEACKIVSEVAQQGIEQPEEITPIRLRGDGNKEVKKVENLLE